MDENLKQIIQDNKKLVYEIIKKYKGKDMQELEQIGMLGLVRGAKSYKQNDKCKISTYLYVCIDNEIKRYFTAQNTQKRNGNKKTTSLDKDIQIGKDNTVTLIDTIPSDINVEKEVENRLDKLIIADAMNRTLKPKEIFVLKNRYSFNCNKEMKQKELAEIMNITRAGVSAIERRALKKLKKELIKIGFEY